MNLRRALLGLVLLGLILLTTAAHRRLENHRTPDPGGERALVAGVLSPTEMVSATLLGGFRSIAIDIIWIRLIRYQNDQRFDELQELYSALEVLQGGSPTLYRILANQLIFDIPHYLPHLPEERWKWIRQGIDLLERGIRRFPENLSLQREAAFVYYLRFDPNRSPGDRERFLQEPVWPEGLAGDCRDPLERARLAGERALEHRDHEFDVDVLLWDIYLLLHVLKEREGKSSGAPAGEDSIGAARRLLDHASRVHQEVPDLEKVLAAWRGHLEWLEKQREGPPPGNR